MSRDIMFIDFLERFLIAHLFWVIIGFKKLFKKGLNLFQLD